MARFRDCGFYKDTTEKTPTYNGGVHASLMSKITRVAEDSYKYLPGEIVDRDGADDLPDQIGISWVENLPDEI